MQARERGDREEKRGREKRNKNQQKKSLVQFGGLFYFNFFSPPESKCNAYAKIKGPQVIWVFTVCREKMQRYEHEDIYCIRVSM